MAKKIDFKNIFVNPIQDFTFHIMNNLDGAVEEFLQKEFEDTKPDLARIDEYANQINALHQSISDRRSNDLIGARGFFNTVIFVLFFFLIGLLFFPIWKKNKRVIEEFDQFETDTLNKIKELTINKNYLIFNSFSTITLKDIYYYIFEYFGINALNNFSCYELFKEINEPNMTDIYSGVTGKIKNTPFYDIIARRLVYKDVTFSNTMSFPYTYTVSTSDGFETRTSYEQLTAYYKVNTPFLEERNLLIYKTNFLKELTISNNNDHFDAKELTKVVENNRFIEKAKIIDHSNKPEQLAQFFTIQTQENFVNWYESQKDAVFNFIKTDNNFVVRNLTYNFESLKFLNKTLDSLWNDNSYQESLTFDDIKFKVKRAVYWYFDRWTKMVQLPLLVPGISREWYRRNGNYLIANDSVMEVEEIDKIEKIRPVDMINKFLDQKFYDFINPINVAKKPIWFSPSKTDKDANGCFVMNFNMNSFRSEWLSKNIAVSGFHVGLQNIPVRYETFYPISEPRLFLMFPKKIKTRSIFLIGNNIKNVVYSGHYNSPEFKKITSDLGIWTNDPSDFEKSPHSSTLINIAKEFMTINKQYLLNAHLRIDEFGFYISLNLDVKKISPQILDILSKMLKKFSLLQICN